MGSKAHPPTHWLGDDGRTNDIRIRGKVLTWRMLQPLSEAPITAKRGNCVGFSKASRLRLLKLLASIDWQEAKPALFITLTYPDGEKTLVGKLTNQHRTLFHRYLEKHLGVNVSVIWRIEWMPRKSGQHIGKYYPHFHLMVFRCRYLDCRLVNEWWKLATGSVGYVRTEVKAMANEKQSGYYVAKYCGKIDGSLVNAAYLDNVPAGRQWGVLRAGLLPRYQEERYILADSPAIRKALARAREISYQGAEHRGSFTLLGGTAIEVMKLLRAGGIDKGKVPE